MNRQIGAVVLAAGQGKRMQAKVAKQFLELGGKPLICYALEAFERSRVGQVVLVTGADQVEYCKKEIVETWGYSKVKAVVPGGKERYHSVYEGLKELGRMFNTSADFEKTGIVLIHDGARPLISEEVIQRAVEGAGKHQACVVGMPVKDTIKVSSPDGFAAGTPDRKSLWQIQTPQAFRFGLVFDAYTKMMDHPKCQDNITDDGMVVEAMTSCPVKLVEGDYRNLKVTTAEDLLIAEALIENAKISEKN